MKQRESRKPKKSRKPRKFRKSQKLGGALLSLFGYIINESVDSSLLDICRRGMQPVKDSADTLHHESAH